MKLQFLITSSLKSISESLHYERVPKKIRLTHLSAGHLFTLTRSYTANRENKRFNNSGRALSGL